MSSPIDLLDTHERRRMRRFVAVGLTSTALDLILLALLKGAGLETLLANTLAFSIAMVYNFTVSRLWTYASGPHKPVAVQFGQFAAMNLLSLGLNDLVMVLLDPPLHALFAQAAWSVLLAKLAATGAVGVWSYMASRMWIFADRRTGRMTAG